MFRRLSPHAALVQPPHGGQAASRAECAERDQAIRERRAQGETVGALAKAFQVGVDTVYRALRGVPHAHHAERNAEIVARWERGETRAELGKAFQLSQPGISRIIIAALPDRADRRRKRPTATRNAEIFSRWLQGATAAELGTMFQLSFGHVRRIVAQANPTEAQVETHRRNKSKRQALRPEAGKSERNAEIFQKWLQGVPLRELATTYNFSAQNAFKLIQRQRPTPEQKAEHERNRHLHRGKL